MANINLELFALVFFWLSTWSIINLLIQWLFKQMGPYHNPGTSFLIYAIILTGTLFVLDRTIDDDIEKDKEDDDIEKDKDNNDDIFI